MSLDKKQIHGRTLMIPFEASIWAFIAVTAAEETKRIEYGYNKTAADLPSTEGSKRFATVNRRPVKRMLTFQQFCSLPSFLPKSRK